LAGFIYKRGNIFWIQYWNRGKRYRESSCSRREEDAGRLLRKRLNEIDEGKPVRAAGERLRFEDLADGLVRDYSINQRKSLDRIELSIRHLKKEFARSKVSNITTKAVETYIEKRLDEGAAPGTINRELTALKRAFNLARISGKLTVIPYIPKLKETNVREGFLEREQFVIMRDNLPKHLRAPFRFAYVTGFRRSEIFKLTWDRVHLKEGYARLEPSDTKTSESRTVYLPAEGLGALKEAHKRRVLGCNLVFHRNGKPIKDPRKSWNKACEAAGVPGLIFHDLRRTAVRNMIRAGIPERVVMQISGHKTRSILDRYNIVSERDLREAAIKLNTYLQG